MSGLEAYGKAMGEVQSDRQMGSSSLTAASRTTPNPAPVDGGIVSHVGGSPVDNDADEHVPPVIAHVRKNFGVLAPTIEPFIYRSGCLNKSVVDVYNHLSRSYPAIVDAALKQVGFEEFTMQMQIMLTQILSEEFGDDTEYLVNTILTYTGADSLFVSLLSKSMLDQVVTFAQSMMGGNMYGMGYNMQGGGGGGSAGRGAEGGGGSNYYRGAQQQQGYRNVGENGAPRDPRGGSVAVGLPHHDGVAPQKPYRSSGLPPQSSDAVRERSSDDVRANSDALSQREEGREWSGGAVLPRSATVTGGGVRVDSSLGPRGAASMISGMGAGAMSRTDMSGSRAINEGAPGSGAMPRHTHHLFSSSTAVSAPSAKSSSMERAGINVVPQHNFLNSRTSPATNQARVTTPGVATVSLTSANSSMPTIGRGGPSIPMHHHHHHVGLGAMATSNATTSDWAAGNGASGSAPNMGSIAQRTLTPPTPQSAPVQQHQLQQQHPARTMNIPAPMSVQRRTEKNAAAAAAAAAAATNAASVSANGSAPTNSLSNNSSTPVVDAGIAPRTMSAPLSMNTNVPAPRGAHSLAHHQHPMPVLHHHHHHRNFTAPPVAVTAAVQPRSPTHSPSASDERVAAIAADTINSTSQEANSSPSSATTSTLATAASTAASAAATKAPTMSAPPSGLRGIGRIPIHHHHHHIHLLVNRVETTMPASSQRQQQLPIPAASQPVSQPHLPPQPQRATTAIEVHEQHQFQQQRQQQQERKGTSNGRWPNQKEELRGILLAARVSESAVNYLLTDVNIDELRNLKYVDFEKKLRGGIPLLLERQRVRQALLDSATLQGSITDNDDSVTSLSRKSTAISVGTEEEPNGSGFPRRSLTVSSGMQSPLSPQQSSPTSKTGVQVPQPRTKMQQQQQQQSQQSVSGGSAMASPTETGLAFSEKETAKRDSATKTESSTTASIAPTSPAPTPTPASTPSPAPTPNNPFSSNTRNEEPDEVREEEHRRGSGRRGGKRGGMGRGSFTSSRVCRFYGTAEGCQFGDKCHYVHNK